MDCKIIPFAESAAKSCFHTEDNTDGMTSSYVDGLKGLLKSITILSNQFELENKDVLMDLLYIQISSELIARCEEK